MNILEVAHGQIKPMTLEERVRKAIENIDKALKEGSKSELETLLSLTGNGYLIQQRMLLEALLESTSW